MERKFPGVKTDRPRGFDHVSLIVDTKGELFALKDLLEAAGVDVHGAVDHGLFWSIYFYDSNNIPLEGVMAVHGTRKTPPEEMVAHSGNGHAMRGDFLRAGTARYLPGQERITD